MLIGSNLLVTKRMNWQEMCVRRRLYTMCSPDFRKGPALPKPGRFRPGTGRAWQTPSLDPMEGASDLTLLQLQADDAWIGDCRLAAAG